MFAATAPQRAALLWCLRLPGCRAGNDRGNSARKKAAALMAAAPITLGQGGRGGGKSAEREKQIRKKSWSLVQDGYRESREVGV